MSLVVAVVQSRADKYYRNINNSIHRCKEAINKANNKQIITVITVSINNHNKIVIYGFMMELCSPHHAY